MTKTLHILASSFLVLVLLGAGCAGVVEEEDSQDGKVILDVPMDEEDFREREAAEREEAENAQDGSSEGLDAAETVDVSENNQGESDGEATQDEQVSQLREFNITAKQWVFEPDTITVSEGDTVRMNITSVDVDHGIALSAFGINQSLKPGETEVIEFVAEKKGSFPFICNVFCGAEHSSMSGTLIVE